MSVDEATIVTVDEAPSSIGDDSETTEQSKPPRTRRRTTATPRKTKAKAAADAPVEQTPATETEAPASTPEATAVVADGAADQASDQTVDGSAEADTVVPTTEPGIEASPAVEANGAGSTVVQEETAEFHATTPDTPPSDQQSPSSQPRREDRTRGQRGRDGSKPGPSDRTNRRDRQRADGHQDPRQSRREAQHRTGTRDRFTPTGNGPRPDSGVSRGQGSNGPAPSTYVQPKSSTNPDHISVTDLNAKSIDELYEVAAKFEIPGYTRVKRPELTIRVLRAQSEAEGDIFGDGVLEIIEDGFGFLRGQRFLPSADDVYVSQSQIRRFALRTGDRISGQVRPPKDNEKFFSLLRVEAVNGVDPEVARRRPSFDSLTPIFPLERIDLETTPNILSTRLLDLVAPIGRGQRGLIVSPPKAGKTMLLKAIANGISANNPDMHLMVCLIGERPEEVTDMRRSIDGDVISSTFDEPVEDHTKVAEMALERAKRLVEAGNDVAILLDSITRLARAYNLAVPPSGRTLSGGMDPVALYPPKRFFGAARNIEGGGSLTIVSTCLVDTGSRMDDVIYEEFKGTGNMELHLDRKLAERRIYPAIDIQRSGTRREELLLDENELRQVWTMRRMVSMLGGSEGTELVLGRLGKTQANKEFLETLNRDV